MYLFLDFDGVLHPTPLKKAALFCNMPLLAAFLSSNPLVKIVVSSTWRKSDDFTKVLPHSRLKKYFPEEFRSRVVGCTPALPRLTVEYDEPIRQREILAWLDSKGKNDAPFVVLDDEKDQFEPGFSNLLLCDSKTGLTQNDIEELQNRVNVPHVKEDPALSM